MTPDQAFHLWLEDQTVGLRKANDRGALKDAFLAGAASVRAGGASIPPNDLKGRITDARANSWPHALPHLMVVRRDEFNALLTAAGDASVSVPVAPATWQPMDTAPKGNAILLKNKDDRWGHARIGFWAIRSRGSGGWFDGMERLNPTGWMPLPSV